eukprot:TRINITY_DN26047_c0_g1_i1.p1 TRINITY_DN26047_c0_g1~~TRINITY_DN26047_c0_g1_i1.p1  ORF type:complete len:840 (+),score=181.93 TRINITY_DN26047_c0_g1_i1:198-2717(+)
METEAEAEPTMEEKDNGMSIDVTFAEATDGVAHTATTKTARSLWSTFRSSMTAADGARRGSGSSGSSQRSSRSSLFLPLTTPLSRASRRTSTLIDAVSQARVSFLERMPSFVSMGTTFTEDYTSSKRLLEIYEEFSKVQLAARGRSSFLADSFHVHSHVSPTLDSSRDRWFVSFGNTLTQMSSGTFSQSSSSSDHSPAVQDMQRRSQSLDSLPKQMCDVAQVRNPELLRASDVDKILHRFGRVLASNVGSANTYAMSEPVDHIDSFISHNWSVPQSTKFLALALNFNMNLAFLLVLVVQILVAGLVYAGILPTFEAYQESPGVEHGRDSFLAVANDGEMISRSPWCKLFGTVTFFVAIVVSHQLSALFSCCVPRSPKHRVFMDKTCIFQEDAQLKRDGIRSLGAFLYYSWSFVVVYSDTYLQKLWTVYELACFMALHPRGHVVVLPTFMSALVLLGNALNSLLVCAVYVTSLRSMQEKMGRSQSYFLLAIVMLATNVLLCSMMRHWAREQKQFKQRLASFSIARATCYDENDRPIVNKNVVSLIRGIHEPMQRVSQDRVLAAFDKLVKIVVPEYMKNSIGRVGLPYRYVVAIALCHFMHLFDNVAVWLRSGRGGRAIMLGVFRDITITFALFPLLLAFLSWMTKKAVLGMPPVLEPLYIFFMAVVLSVSYVIGMTLVMDLEHFARASAAGLVTYTAFILALFVFTSVIYFQGWRHQYKERFQPQSPLLHDLAAVCHEEDAEHFDDAADDSVKLATLLGRSSVAQGDVDGKVIEAAPPSRGGDIDIVSEPEPACGFDSPRSSSENSDLDFMPVEGSPIEDKSYGCYCCAEHVQNILATNI